MGAEIDKQARSEFKLSGSGAIGWQAVKGSRKGRVERDEERRG